ncbi:MAG: hypothetical protein Q9181_002922, partial [Wetmoreana brouardii]
DLNPFQERTPQRAASPARSSLVHLLPSHQISKIVVDAKRYLEVPHLQVSYEKLQPTSLASLTLAPLTGPLSHALLLRALQYRQFISTIIYYNSQSGFTHSPKLWCKLKANLFPSLPLVLLRRTRNQIRPKESLVHVLASWSILVRVRLSAALSSTSAGLTCGGLNGAWQRTWLLPSFNANIPLKVDRCPVIVGDSYDLAETDCVDGGWEQSQGLPGQADDATVLLSMSGYGKSSDHGVNESTISPSNGEADNGLVYGERRSLGNTGYIGHGNYGYGASIAQPLPYSYEQTEERLAFSTDTFYAPRPSYHTSQLSYTRGRSQNVPMVVSWSPDQGSQGTPVDIRLQSTHELDPLTDYGVFVMFAETQCSAILSRVESHASSHTYVIGTNAPAFSSTGWRSQHVPVYLRIQDQPGLETDNINVGHFRYTDLDRFALSSPQGLPQKRDLSIASSQVLGPVAKRTFSQQLRSPARQIAQVYIPGLYHPSNSGKPQASQSHIQTPSASPYSANNAGKSPFKNSSLTVCGATDRSSGGRGLQGLGWSPTYAAINGTSSRIGASSIKSLSGSPSSFTDPVLVRTINLPSTSSRSSVSGPRSARDPFGPYPSHPYKANLIVNGNLDSMAQNWTAEECRVKRRVVQFSRFQRGGTLYTSFEPTTVEDRVPNSICVSCIWWREENGHFITSVDILDLFEKLICGHEGKFSDVHKARVMEQNRIRRNLEGFGPITVSKTPPEDGSERPNTVRFFNQIMSFGDPKPRRIAKDVKVFKWQDLKHGLQKVMGKYVSTPGRSILVLFRRQQLMGSDGIKVGQLLVHQLHQRLWPNQSTRLPPYSEQQRLRPKSQLSSFQFEQHKLKRLQHRELCVIQHVAECIAWFAHSISIVTSPFSRNACQHTLCDGILGVAGLVVRGYTGGGI